MTTRVFNIPQQSTANFYKKYLESINFLLSKQLSPKEIIVLSHFMLYKVVNETTKELVRETLGYKRMTALSNILKSLEQKGFIQDTKINDSILIEDSAVKLIFNITDGSRTSGQKDRGVGQNTA